MASLEGFAIAMCSLCHKAKGTCKCQGCLQVFCTTHWNDHRTALKKQFNEITMTHDLIKQTLNQQTEDPHKNSLIEQINQWENKSIELIRKTAEELRDKLLNGVIRNITQIKQKLQSLSDELRQGQKENDLSEIDLRQWTARLEHLRIELINPTTVTLQEDSVCLVKNIRIHRQDQSDVFERTSTNAQIEENGRFVKMDSLTNYAEVRGKQAYSIGTSQICFRVENLEQNGWIFFGIIYKFQSMQSASYVTSSSYGWSNRNKTYSAGQFNSSPTFQIAKNDMIVLTMDCDQRKIHLTNKRLNRSIELPVDIEKCPFPWQVHLNLHQANTHIRIMDSLD